MRLATDLHRIDLISSIYKQHVLSKVLFCTENIVRLKVELTHRTLLLGPTDNANVCCERVNLTIRLTRGRR